MESSEPVASPPEAPTPAPRTWGWLSNQNPFYLFSAACVMHSTGWSIGDANGLPAWLTPALIAGYIALLAIAGGVIVRLWKVWDDARTIFVTLLILFLELALSLDQFAIRSPGFGVIAILAGWLFAAVISESLLLGLGMRLPTLYRSSFHLQLALLFGYPLLLIPGTQLSIDRLTTALLLGFAVVIAVPLLMLWPAVRRGPQSLMPNGTPWTWPCYPWTLPTVLSCVLVARAYSLCLTFDPVSELNAQQAYEQFASIFGGYFAVPTLFAAGCLILESGIVSGRRRWQFIGLLAPVVALLASLSWDARNAAADAVLAQLTSAIGSPVWLTLLLGVAFYAVASFRGVRGAPRCLAVALGTLTVVSPAAIAWNDLTPPPAWIWMLAAALSLGRGIRQNHSLHALESCLYATLAVGRAGLLSEHFWDPQRTAGVLFVLICLITLIFNDALANELREFCVGIISLAGLYVAAPAVFPQATWWSAPGCLAALAVLAGWFWGLRATDGAKGVCGFVAALCYMTTFLQGSYAIDDAFHWAGLPAFATGLGLLHVGIVISAWKGLAQRRTVNPSPPPLTTDVAPA